MSKTKTIKKQEPTTEEPRRGMNNAAVYMLAKAELVAAASRMMAIGANGVTEERFLEEAKDAYRIMTSGVAAASAPSLNLGSR